MRIVSDIIKQAEGLRLIAYRDGRGVWTIGYGHTGPNITANLRISRSEAEALYLKDIAWAEAAVSKHVKPTLTQNQFDALVSFVFNIGETNFRLSTMLRKLNNSDWVGAQAQFARWNKITEPLTGYLKVDKGLTNRRAAERALFNSKE